MVNIYFSLFSQVSPQTENLNLLVEYPDSSNRSFVHLLCVSEDSIPVKGAVFFKNTSRLASGSKSSQVTSLNFTGDGEVSFLLTQEQEGDFYCASGDRVSGTVQLAGN